MLDANITLVGNLIDNPNLRITPTGAYVCSFRLASTARRYDRGQDRWIDGAPLFIDIICWRRLAETLQGERRRRYEIYAEAVGLELTWHPARVNRAVRGDGTMTVQPGRADGSPPAPGGPPDVVAQDGSAELADVPWADGDIPAEVSGGLPPVPDLDEVTGDLIAGWAAVGEDDQP
jgi:single-strand DNA-binding protein